ncbi:hypothetical protein SELR_13990 [Selenomonas ruminantium subsp. lactilytica TAM6421]|uniref:Uncharacterized protein n=1 Tax=Selenomonas ruminantium subsp. lactilytica (strain NBRC 103574 / TAM6421) TaxID=927704 RepID=I0GQS0_SELRL|nr:hypothetical protein [Selenomonas ruminantium]BAL83107.1 hypothetical protein SELR_13990 [Selenomonas ruminantium subsp. lactilytica TAM6421]
MDKHITDEAASKQGIEREAGKNAVEYAKQMAWLISLRKLEYITEEEYNEAHKRLNIKYHQPHKF